MKLLVTGGGTGGHFYPALSVMKKVREKEPDSQFCFVGTEKGIETKLRRQYDWIDLETIHMTGLSRNSLGGFLSGVFTLPVGMIETLSIILRYRPDVIYGTGSYTTFPAAVWGYLLGIPVFAQEMNVKPGMTNRIISRFATKLLLSYSETKRFLNSNKLQVTGPPIREQIQHEDSTANSEAFGLDPNLPTVLLFGGSLGSETLIRKLFEELDRKKPDSWNCCQFLVQAGKEADSNLIAKLKSIETPKVVVKEYIEEMGKAYALSDFVICRGGAGTLAELIATRKPALIVPWEGAAEDHQYFNGKLIQKAGAGLLVREEKWPEFPLLERLAEITGSRGTLNDMSEAFQQLSNPQGSEKVCAVLKNTITQGEKC